MFHGDSTGTRGWSHELIADGKAGIMDLEDIVQGVSKLQIGRSLSDLGNRGTRLNKALQAVTCRL